MLASRSCNQTPRDGRIAGAARCRQKSPRDWRCARYPLRPTIPPSRAVHLRHLSRNVPWVAPPGLLCVRLIRRRWDGLGVTEEVRTVLNANVRSLFFNGQYDLICNHVSLGLPRTRCMIGCIGGENDHTLYICTPEDTTDRQGGLEGGTGQSRLGVACPRHSLLGTVFFLSSPTSVRATPNALVRDRLCYVR